MQCHGIAGSEDPELANLKKLKGVLRNYTLDILPGETHQTSWRHPSIPERIEKFLDRGGRPLADQRASRPHSMLATPSGTENLRHQI